MKKFDLPWYLHGLGITVLISGLIISLVLAFTIINVKVQGYYHEYTEFSLSGFIITVGTLLATLFIHAFILWLANMLTATEDIRSHFIDKIQDSETREKIKRDC